MSTELPSSSIPLLTTAAAFREWREKALLERKSVGYVPTMGALHEGHLSLVRRCLMENDLTVLSIFVNPAQFAPHEDLATYPRTLEQDIAALTALNFTPSPSCTLGKSNGASSSPGQDVRTPSAIFLPDAREMYPSGITQDVSAQKGTFVEVKGYSHQMEGKSRPTFFRGVATIVMKLFNVVQPTRVYLGQKDIQQALLLKRMARDLLISRPLAEDIYIVPTARDQTDGLALSSRNAYLSRDGRKVASTLYQALNSAQAAWDVGLTKVECLSRAHEVVEARIKQTEDDGLKVDMRLDFVEFNDADSFDVVEDGATKKNSDAVLLSGALFIDSTRLIDNLILGNVNKILR